MIAHEQAHLTRHDPQVLTLALFLLVLMPWNVPLWWQVHRLRRAIEVDCDARVLEKGLDPEKYRQMLTEVGRRTSGHMGMVAAMSESPSLLQQRLRLMADPVQRGPVAASMLVLLAFAFVTVAAQVTPPNAGDRADGASHGLRSRLRFSTGTSDSMRAGVTLWPKFPAADLSFSCCHGSPPLP